MQTSPAITILGSNQPTSRGFARRTLLQAVGLSLLGGVTAGQSLFAKDDATLRSNPPARAKSVVLIYLQGAHRRRTCSISSRMRRPASAANSRIYHILGIDPEMAVLDRAKRPVPIAHGGRPILEILS